MRSVWVRAWAILIAAAIGGPGSPGTSPAASGITGVDGAVRALAVYGGDLIAAGDFQHAGAVEAAHIARWDGNSWHPLGAGTDAPVHALIVLGNDLVVGGEFTHAGGVPAAHVARWNGTSWRDLGAGTNGAVYALAQQQGVFLYVGGEFTTAGMVAAHGVARWVFGTWSGLDSGLGGRVRGLAVSQNRLSACGDIVLPRLNLSVRVATFDGTLWNDANPALLEASAYVLRDHGGELHLGGRFAEVDWQTTGYSIGRQVGDRWLPLGYGFNLGEQFDPGHVFALTTFGTDLIAGGRFDTADVGPAANIARWNGSVWSPLGAGIDGDVRALAVYAGQLVAGGAFSHAGGVPVSNVALYDGIEWSSPTTAVEIEAFRAHAGPDGVRLQWSLSADAARDLAAVVVERSPEVGARFDEVSQPLPAEREMSYLDAGAGATVIAYRLQLRGRDGTRHVGPELRVHTAAATLGPGIVAVVDPGGAEPIRIRFRTGPLRAPLALSMHDVRGRRVHVLDSGWRDPGEHVVQWDRHVDGAPAARGVYVLRLQTGARTDAHKLLVR